jgi:hypothetical protein
MERAISRLRIIGLLVCAAWLLAFDSRAAADEWRAIFDGRSLDGWQQVGAGEFRLAGSELVSEGGMGALIYSRQKLSNCQVRVVFKIEKTNDMAGVFVRVPELPRDGWEAVNRGYLVAISNQGDPWHRTGCLSSFTRAQTLAMANLGDWNTMIVTLFGPRTRVHVNVVLVTDFTEGQPVPEKQRWYEGDRGKRPNFGYVGLQNYGDSARVHFKEVSVRKLE